LIAAAVIVSPRIAKGDFELGFALVVTESHRPANPLGIFQPKFLACDTCQAVHFTSPGGYELSARPEVEPRAKLRKEQIASVKVVQLRNPYDPTVQIWEVLVTPDESAKTPLVAIMQEYPYDHVLVTLDGKPIDVSSVIGWSRGVRIAGFPTREAAKPFVDSLGLPASWRPMTDEEVRRSQQEIQERVKEAGPKGPDSSKPP
jgi:hypothetical protein